MKMIMEEGLMHTYQIPSFGKETQDLQLWIDIKNDSEKSEEKSIMGKKTYTGQKTLH